MAEYTDSTFDYRKDYTEDQLVHFAAARPLDFSPGDRWSYSNTGYLLLGVLVHRVTRKFYGEVLRNLIFSPLGMRTTRIISEADIVPNRAAGYQLIHGQVKNQDWVAPSLNTTADGSLYFSIKDLVRWAVSLNHARIPDSAALRGAWSPVRLNDGGLYPYGFGWGLSPQRGRQRIGHTGAWQGFKTAIYRYPEFKLTVIALANLAQAEPGAIAEGVAGMLEPALQPPHRFQTPLKGALSPLPVGELLVRIVEGTDTSAVTPGLHRFLSPPARKELGQLLAPVRSWTAVGCDDVSGRQLTWLAASIARVCYYTGTAPDKRMVVSVAYNSEWRAAHLDPSAY
jgi:CubicO group peptidase (beta-lactamase class C family)